MRRAELSIKSVEGEREWTVEEIPVLRATVALPQPVEESAWRRIGGLYRIQRRAFLRYCEGELLPQATAEAREALGNGVLPPLFEADLSWRETYRTGRLWSLYTETREHTAPGPPSLHRWGDTWDLRTGYPLPLSAFFPPRFPWRKRLLETAEAAVRRQEARGEAQYLPDWRRRMRRSFRAGNYYLTPEGIAFFFPMYALAPAVEGIPVFLLPWEGEAPEGPLR